MQNNQWKEIKPEMKMEFLRIVKILNRYYESQSMGNTRDRSNHFRKSLESKDPGHVSVYLKKFGNYEFLVCAEILEKNPTSAIQETWIHIDGIQEERDSLEKQGIKSHPIYEIVGLNDIYQNGTKATKRKNLPE